MGPNATVFYYVSNVDFTAIYVTLAQYSSLSSR